MIELEKKWLLKEVPNLCEYGFGLLKIEEILQTYLSENERLRRISLHQEKEGLLNPEEGPSEDPTLHYQHFTKTWCGTGSCVEELRDITEEEYEQYLLKAVSQVEKIRLTFIDPDTKLKYEVDVLQFTEPRVDIALMEVEFQDRYENMTEVDENFVLPDLFDRYVLMDVTDNRKFSNFNLSEPVEYEK